VKINMVITPLIAAAMTGGNIGVIKQLFQYGADPNLGHPLSEALRNFKDKKTPDNLVADSLVAGGAQVDSPDTARRRTLLHLYAAHEEIQAVAWLLNNGASVSARTLDGRMPLHLAADRNNGTKVIEQLLEAGADINARDEVGNTPLFYAKQSDKHKTIAYLQKREASL